MKAAQLLAEHDELWALACYHFHQAAEKSLKGFLIHTGQKVPRVHDLQELVGRCAEQDPGFSAYEDNAVYLNPFYIEARYPMLSPLKLSEKRVKEAGLAARRIVSFVIERLYSDKGR